MGAMDEMDARMRGKQALRHLEAAAGRVAELYGSDSMCGGLLSLMGQIVVGTVINHQPDAYKTDEERRRAVVAFAKEFGTAMQRMLRERGITIEYLDLSTPPHQN